MEDSVRIDLIGRGLAWENVTKAKTNSAGNALLEIAPRVAAMEAEVRRLKAVALHAHDQFLRGVEDCDLLDILARAWEPPNLNSTTP